MKTCVRTGIFLLLGLALIPLQANAQTTVRVSRDQTTIWRAGFSIVASVVQAGTILEVVGRRDNWYEVIVPGGPGAPPGTGFIAANRVEMVSGAGREPRAPGQSGARVGARRAPPRPTLARRGVRGFADLGYGRFAAHKSFDAVLARSGGPWYGGGAEFRSGPWAFEGSVERFEQTGERAFVLDERVFRLGIPDTITIVPIAGTIGYRRPFTPAWSVLAGVGAGRYLYREASTVAAVTETFSRPSTSYHLRANVEWHRRGLVATAAEIQYTFVPRALSGGVAASFDEHDLGGVQVRLKVLVGR
jgi:hypothetical protein